MTDQPSATPPAALDSALADLQARKRVWARLPAAEKLGYLDALNRTLQEQAEAWVATALPYKQIAPDSPWTGEEWATGPWALAEGIKGLQISLRALAAGRVPTPPRVSTRGNGQVVARVFPYDTFTRLSLPDITADVWMEPDITRATLGEHTATFYREREPDGQVALVLGAGNLNSIAPLDTLHCLYADGAVVLVKLNPVNAYIGPILEQVFAPLVRDGFVRFAYGDGAVGAYLTAHPAVERIHITGSARTHDAIVFGGGPDGAARKQAGTPLLSKPITSELGGVCPILVVPGPWRAEELRFHAATLATARFYNHGYNCVAAQVIVLPEGWEGSARLMDEMRTLVRALPPREPYYPGTQVRHAAALAAHPQAESLGGGSVPRTLISGLDAAQSDALCFREEFFGPVYAQTSVPGRTAREFLQNAVQFCNETLSGSLSASILIHPRTMAEYGPELAQALEALRYSAIGVNVWAAGAFLLAQVPWGAYGGHPLTDIQSGRGFVHNAFLFARPQKTIVRGPFMYLPGTWRAGEFTLMPYPGWYITSRYAGATMRRATQLALVPSWGNLVRLAAMAFRERGE